MPMHQTEVPLSRHRARRGTTQSTYKQVGSNLGTSRILLSTMITLEDVPLIPLLVGATVAWRGLKKGSLSMDGALAAFVVGSTMLSTALRVFGITMLVFYFAGSRATRVGKELKVKLEEGVREGAGQRDAVQVCSSNRCGIEFYVPQFHPQVFCNSLPAFVACIVWRALFTNSWLSGLFPSIDMLYDPATTCALSSQFGDGWSRFLVLVALGQFGCCLGDTLASELGILSGSKPILITTLKTVPPGTNGGMSLLGTGASIAGGGFIGLTMVLDLLVENSACRALGVNEYVNICLLGLLSGGLGSLVTASLFCGPILIDYIVRLLPWGHGAANPILNNHKARPHRR
jgi:uncharacterized membrane protein